MLITGGYCWPFDPVEPSLVRRSLVTLHPTSTTSVIPYACIYCSNLATWTFSLMIFNKFSISLTHKKAAYLIVMLLERKVVNKIFLLCPMCWHPLRTCHCLTIAQRVGSFTRVTWWAQDNSFLHRSRVLVEDFEWGMLDEVPHVEVQVQHL